MTNSRFLKILIIVAVLALLSGGFWLYQYFSQKNDYKNSPDKIADEFIAAMVSGDTDKAYDYLSNNLKNDHSKSFWLEFFDEYKGYNDELALAKKEEVRSTDPSEPDPYDNTFQPWRFVYDLKRGDLAYQLTMVIYKPSDQWKINELKGDYVPVQ
ncbi:MAG: NTF2-like N-terminal transpeptidase domain-containing protein [Candidatus Woesebacteria bacterium]|jgi:hypothetical protein